MTLTESSPEAAFPDDSLDFEISENLWVYFQYTNTSFTHTENEMYVQAAAEATTLELAL